jgi:hypothetical protein
MVSQDYQAELVQLLAQSDPETLKELMRLGVLGEEQVQMFQQQQTAEALRSTPLPRGEMRGRVYVPASGMENALAFYDRIRGEVGAAGARSRQKEILGEKTAGRMSYLDLLKRQQGDRPAEEPIKAPFEF